MAVDITEEIFIERTREQVAAYVMEPENDPIWLGGIVEVGWVSEPPLAEGSLISRAAKFLGRRLEYTYEVVELEPGSKISMRTDKPFEMATSYEFDEADGGTRMTAHLWGGGDGFYRLAGPVLAAAVRRSISSDLRSLKEILEG